MNRLFPGVALAALLSFSAQAFAYVTLKNEDSRTYKILIADSENCFAGLHTSIGGSTTITVDPGYLCLKEKKPAILLEDGATYVIKDGAVTKQ